MSLSYLPFTAIEPIKKAAKGGRPFRIGDRGFGVMAVQAGLIDLGYKMPLTISKTGFPDGRYGNETKKVIIQFQADMKLVKDGIVGRNTLAALDKRLSTKYHSPLKPKKLSIPTVPKPLIPSNKEYKIGVSNPTIIPDFGAGIFDSEPAEVSMWVLKQGILEVLPNRRILAVSYPGRDAAYNMKYYMDGMGMSRKIDLEKMIESGATAKGRFRDEVGQVQKFVQTLPIGVHDITSRTAETAYNYKAEITNWFFAVGGYSTWGKGKVCVSKDSTGNSYELDFEYHFFDRYNWDGGKSVTIGPFTITDEFMGKFHRQGLAREYDMRSFIKRKFTWRQGEAIPESQYRRGR